MTLPNICKWGAFSLNYSFRTCLINVSCSEGGRPQGLKPACLLDLIGTTEVVPFPNPFMRPVVVPLVPKGYSLLIRKRYCKGTQSRAFLAR